MIEQVNRRNHLLGIATDAQRGLVGNLRLQSLLWAYQ